MRPYLSVLFAITALLPVPALAQSAAPSLTGTPLTSVPACAPVIIDGVLPEWARAGFGSPEPEALYSLGRDGLILGVLFGHPYTAPATPGKNNKILWVAPVVDGSDLVIDGQRMEGSVPVGDPVRVTVEGGPGPSTVDMPEAGCWRLSLRWGGQVDSMDLEYLPLDATSPASPSPSGASQ